ncbi:Hypothetical protein MHO_4320 [Metamycoplasma hominis ATCC 23114]|uniref:Uncharacterized protein n=1 Tax=Metamycoplasma hominis (strain ATCC 23114 / DSM 25592 / NBRC 14850 / NCTC 10111 / PG21) TaxID=347256 RepID=D1J8M0_METH1|nr:Hypothetical protein MHO_4320 [Metamycoplasma hominis ATCC 23114]
MLNKIASHCWSFSFAISSSFIIFSYWFIISPADGIFFAISSNCFIFDLTCCCFDVNFEHDIATIGNEIKELAPKIDKIIFLLFFIEYPLSLFNELLDMIIININLIIF